MLLHCQDHVQLPEDVGGEGRGRVAPRRRHVGLGREMEDPIRLDRGKRGMHAGFVGDVRNVELHAIAEVYKVWMRPRRLSQTPHLGTPRQARIRQMTTRKPGDAGNEYAHGERLLESCEAVGSCGDYTRL